ncbi:hypothetical protein EDC04DRAFT_2017261 [Pisolithus marmoratus]|nr:hypothetical protein EDC04DRAFT_2017261 [Pisolithus marmoratus]
MISRHSDRLRKPCCRRWYQGPARYVRTFAYVIIHLAPTQPASVKQTTLPLFYASETHTLVCPRKKIKSVLETRSCPRPQLVQHGEQREHYHSILLRIAYPCHLISHSALQISLVALGTCKRFHDHVKDDNTWYPSRRRNCFSLEGGTYLKKRVRV